MNDDLWKLPILAVVQGITEFLPVSSSGHLVMCQHLFGLKNPEQNLLVTVVLHAGTLLAILAYYRKDLWSIVTQRRWRLALMVAMGTVPIGIFGLVLESYDLPNRYFGALWLTMVSYLLSAGLLLFLHRRAPQPRTIEQLGWRDALSIGLMQCVAVLPGVSRSGSTIAAATRLGIRQEDAARFSFYIGIVPIAGANILLAGVKLLAGKAPASGVSPVALAIGFVVSAVVGYGALAWLIRLLQGGKFHRFGYYCLFLAIVLAIHLLTRHTAS